MHAHETFLIFLSHRTVHIIARIGTVCDDQLFPVLGTSFHYILHGADIGIETGAYILNVKHNQVYIL
mgnify:CR=1 FL=1